MASSISVDDFVALNDEIAALVRAGVPLDKGLARWGRDAGGRVGRITTELSAAAARGEPLEQSLTRLDVRLPEVYRAVVVAGVKSGRLPSALESLSAAARRLQEARALVGLAMIYPLALLLLGYGLLLLIVGWVLPVLMQLYDGNPPPFWNAVVTGGERLIAAELPIPFTQLAMPAVIVPPVVLLALALLIWWRTRSAVLLDRASSSWWLVWAPRARRVARHARTASLAEMLALMVESGVPLGEAIRLAAACTVDKRLATAAEQTGLAIEQGSTLDSQRTPLTAFGPSIAWLLGGNHQQHTFVTMANHLASTNRSKLSLEIAWLRDYLPIWLSIFVGGAVALLLALALFLPYTQFIHALSESTSTSVRVR